MDLETLKYLKDSGLTDFISQKRPINEENSFWDKFNQEEKKIEFRWK